LWTRHVVGKKSVTKAPQGDRTLRVFILKVKFFIQPGNDRYSARIPIGRRLKLARNRHKILMDRNSRRDLSDEVQCERGADQ